MDRSDVLTLCVPTFTEDAIGQQIATYTDRDVYCNISSVSGNEWFEAGRNGIKAELKVTMFRYDYEDETECKINGVRYGIYRTYIGRDDTIELYLERKAGLE